MTKCAQSEGLEWLYSTQLFGIKLGLEAPRRLLREVCGIDPDQPPFRIIHVAGTNGKGSTCAFADRLLREAGVRTGLFTSPHLVSFSERMRVAGVPIGEPQLEEDLAWIRKQVAHWDPHPTFFELTLALAMRHFVREEVEVVVLETGMGGRLDATNSLSKVVAAITPVALDHAQWLGASVEKIAAEKAGIIQAGTAVVCAPQGDGVEAVLRQAAAERGSSIRFVEAVGSEVELGLVGEHQRVNAALALAALEAVGFELSAEQVSRALASTSWAGRFELRDQGQLILDGAHNQHAALGLSAAWQERFGDEKALMICGIVDKDAKPMLDAWREIAEEGWFVPVPSPRTTDPQALTELWRKRGGQARTFDSLAAALDEARQDGRRVLVVGSLFLIGEATSLLNQGAAVHETMQ